MEMIESDGPTAAPDRGTPAAATVRGWVCPWNLRSRRSRRCGGWPGCRGWPLAGNLIAFRRDPLGFLRRLGRLPGPLWQLWLGPQRVVVGSSPEVAEALLVRLAPAPEKGPVVRRWSRPLLGEGLISAGSEVHGATARSWRR